MSIAVEPKLGAAPARCSIGYLYHAQSARLLRFDRFLQGRPEPAGQAPKVLLQQWTAQGRTLDDAWECEQTAESAGSSHLKPSPAISSRSRIT